MHANKKPTLVDHVESVRQSVNQGIDPAVRAEFAQFMTPPSISRLMASMFQIKAKKLSLLDPGAGVGSLTAAFVEFVCSLKTLPKTVLVTAYEIDRKLARSLKDNLRLCGDECMRHGIDFQYEVRQDDFIASGLFNANRFDFVLMNPPYRKINSQSETRSLLRAQGIETSNLYAAFMAVAARQLADNGQFVSITPRSFCNGTYFRSFRHKFLRSMSFRRIHVYESRSTAFAGDDVLQENVIVYARKSPPPKRVTISTTTRSGEKSRTVPYWQIVHPKDPEAFIRIVADQNGEHVAKDINALPCILHELAIEVSTGRVVDFRAKEHLRDNPAEGTVPLIYPCHMRQGRIEWPITDSKKPNAILCNDATAALLVPSGIYVLVKRFTAKEEKRRVVASIFRPSDGSGNLIGLENHTNYYHKGGAGLDEAFAVGLAMYLNSTVLDDYFRLFSGHTQVNATDLRSIPYPSRDTLIALGKSANGTTNEQAAIDALIEKIVFGR